MSRTFFGAIRYYVFLHLHSPDLFTVTTWRLAAIRFIKAVFICSARRPIFCLFFFDKFKLCNKHEEWEQNEFVTPAHSYARTIDRGFWISSKPILNEGIEFNPKYVPIYFNLCITSMRGFVLASLQPFIRCTQAHWFIIPQNVNYKNMYIVFTGSCRLLPYFPIVVQLHFGMSSIFILFNIALTHEWAMRTILSSRSEISPLDTRICQNDALWSIYIVCSSI